MPIYQYECMGCSHPFEELVSANASPPPCPACAAGLAQRVLSVVTVGRSAAPARALAQSFSGKSGGGGCGASCLD